MNITVEFLDLLPLAAFGRSAGDDTAWFRREVDPGGETRFEPLFAQPGAAMRLVQMRSARTALPFGIADVDARRCGGGLAPMALHAIAE